MAYQRLRDFYKIKNKSVSAVAPAKVDIVPSVRIDNRPSYRSAPAWVDMVPLVIGIDVITDNEVTVNQEDRLEGTFVIGKTGSGKSTLIENKVLQDVYNDLGVVLLDPHGQLIDKILRRMDYRLEDVVLIDLGSDDYVAPFNLFHCTDTTSFKEVVRIVSGFMHVLESFYDISHKNPQMNQYFTNIAKTLVYNPEYTMLDIPRLLDDEVFRKRLVANIPDVHVKWFWERFYEKYRVGVRRFSRGGFDMRGLEKRAEGVN